MAYRHEVALCVLGVSIVAAGMLFSEPAQAYPWMIRHDYTGCNACHADPSGGGLLTQYGRAQGEVLMRSRFGEEAEQQEPGRVAGFLFGLFEPPEPLLLGGGFRGMQLSVQPEGAPFMTSFILMQADLAGQLTVGRFRANGSLGLATDGAFPAAITKGNPRLISRIFWAGVDLGEDNQFVVRAGRMNLPFGLRLVEHNAWVRSKTGTDENAGQNLGLSLAYLGENLRGEIMGIAGNFQVSPDEFRERGYSGYLEWAPSTNAALGLSSLVTHAQLDLTLQEPAWRHAHGLFARWAPITPLVVSFEADGILASTPTANHIGYTGLLQVDHEPVQGLHLIATGEILQPDAGGDEPSLAGWLSADWFLAPHTDLRFDLIEQSMVGTLGRQAVTSILAQLHVFL